MASHRGVSETRTSVSKPASARRLACLLALASGLATHLCGTLPAQSDARPPSPAKLSTHALHEYVGTLGNDLRIGISLRFTEDRRKITGTYFYAKHGRDIRIEGEADGRTVKLREFDETGRQTASFNGQFPEQDPRGRYGGSKLDREVLTGIWSKLGDPTERPFEVSLSHICFAKPNEPRYAASGFTNDSAVEAFAQKFRAAVLKRDVDAVAGMLAYPIQINVGGRKQFANTSALKQSYDLIFDPGFVKRIEAAIPFHMFARDQGVMLGNGEAWITPYPLKSDPDGKPVLVPRISAINR